LAVTFTNKAAKEMGERITKLLAENQTLNLPVSLNSKPFVATFHSLGAFIIKENAEVLGLKKHFSIYDREDSKRAVKEALVQNGYDPKQFEPNKILAIISREKGNFISVEEYSEFGSGDYMGNIISKVWQDYEASLKKENALDFDDLLLKTAKLLQQEPIRKKYSERWRYLHIDEYQDTNKVQYQIAEAIARDHQNICVVGDVDQNIYTWRNASIKNILHFEKDYKNSKLVVLEENYRSTKTILEIANRTIEKNKLRMERRSITSKKKIK
jgi:DNA helicase-2/ATP-dependent DNA helicase PcrA